LSSAIGRLEADGLVFQVVALKGQQTVLNIRAVSELLVLRAELEC
jgi:hypothetical protein